MRGDIDKEVKIVRQNGDGSSCVPIKSFYYEEIDSTMEEAKRLVSSGSIKETSYIVANSQTSGRGTRGRVWSSPKGTGIYLSLIHLPEENSYFKSTTLYTQASGIACVETLKEFLNIEAKIKPINDIYYDGKKLAGILLESKINTSGLSLIITGIGVNIKKFDHKLDREDINPISIEEIISKDLDKESKEDFIRILVDKICLNYQRLFSGETDFVTQKWSKYSLHI